MGIAANHLSAGELHSIALSLLTEPQQKGADIWAHCPWHSEHTPGNAFHYTPAKDWACCHSCGQTGDIIDLYAATQGLEVRQACRQFLAEHCPQAASNTARPSSSHTPALRSPGQISWQAKPATTPAQTWLEHATKMVSWAQEQLTQNSQAMDYLSGRGISAQAAADYSLGLIPKDIWRERKAWGLEPKYRDDGKEKKLWIPAGIVIPYFVDDCLHRVRIRRWQGEPRYYWVPGSGNQTMLLPRQGSSHLPDAALVVETELDAVALHHVAGDLVHVVALGSSSAKPRSPVSDLLTRCVSILVAADFDQAGIEAWQWWQRTFQQATYWPAPAGKDVGDAAQVGVPLRDWVVCGLPPAWSIGPSALGGLNEGGGDNNSEAEAQEQGQASSADPEDMGQNIQNNDSDLPDEVNEFRRLVATYPVQIAVESDQLAVREDPAWARDHWDAAKRISDLLFFNDEVISWVRSRAEQASGVLHAGNI